MSHAFQTVDTVARDAESALQANADRLVSREVVCCLSHMVSTLAQAYGMADSANPDLVNLSEQAFELASPISDFEEAAIQAGWSMTSDGSEGSQVVFTDSTDGQTWCAASWQELCEEFDIEPYDREVYEFWAVSTWLAEKLSEAGERVDTDFANLNVWARTTTGQAISMDDVIRRIATELHAA